MGVRKTIAGDVSLFNFRCHQNRRVLVLSGRVRRVPADWPDGDRHGGDVSLTCCFRRERGKVHPDTVARSRAATGSLCRAKTRNLACEQARRQETAAAIFAAVLSLSPDDTEANNNYGTLVNSFRELT